jgi:hypothetical protein
MAANGTRVETPTSIEYKTARLEPKYRALSQEMAIAAGARELAASGSPYATPINGIGGSVPAGLGFTFGDSWARTQRGVMEFSMPSGQVDNINMAYRYVCENAFVAKAIKLKTLFITKGLSNQTGDDVVDGFLDQVRTKLAMDAIHHQAVFLYNTAGIVPIILPDKNDPLDWIELWDPRYVRIQRQFGKITMWVVADPRMKAAAADPNGIADPRNKNYWDALPKSWKKQLQTNQKNPNGDLLITLDPESYICIDARDMPFDRQMGGFDGTPLQPYFASCDQYRMLMAADFASAFLSKNLLALVSVGDPQAEGELYLRPDDGVLSMLQSAITNPNQAQWLFVDPTFNVRYITPDPNTFDNKKYNEPKEALKNLLPSPFWYNDGGGSFAAATIEMKQLEEEVEACQNVFDDKFWTPIYQRAAEGRTRIANSKIKPPKHDRSALRDRIQDLTAKSALFANGGLDIKTLIAEHGYDPDVIKQRLESQQADVKKGIYMPSFEANQGIVSTKTYAIPKLQAQQAPPPKPTAPNGGRPAVSTSTPKAETTGARAPRSSGK